MSITLDRPVADTASDAVTAWLQKFEKALTAGDAKAAAGLFVTDGFWRDFLSFTWNLKTCESPAEIEAMLEATLGTTKPQKFHIAEPADAADGIISAWINFETATARGWGHIRLRDGMCWTLLTTMTELKGFEERRGPAREMGAEHGVVRDRKTWLERRHEEQSQLGYTTQPYVLVIGGGQGGLGLGARLKRLGVSAIIVDKHPRPGDQWRSRYKSLCLHDPVWYDHMPYLPFPDHWPVFSPKDKIGDWLEMYAKVMELNTWNSTTADHAEWDDARKEWVVQLTREGKPVTLRPKHLVLATGLSAIPYIPKYQGAETFKGEQVHSSQYKSGVDYAGKKAVVIGSNNSSFDICADLWENGADVTMIQRSSTHIAKSDSLMELALGGLYSEAALAAGVTTDKADMLFASVPYKILHTFQIPVYAEMKRRDAELYDRLEKAGFMLDFGDDGSGLFMKYLRRGSGYYIDVGASELVANGSVKLKSRVNVTEITPTGVKFDDGTELPADLIVYATGYSSMNGWAAKLISQDVADKVGKCWGLGSGTTKDPGPWEGELRIMWKPATVENLWFHGGNLHQSRHYSKFLALQLKARLEGVATPVYGQPEVHHKS